MQAVAAAVTGVLRSATAEAAPPQTSRVPAGSKRTAAAEASGDASAEELLQALRAARSAQRRKKKERRRADKAGAPAEHRVAEAAPTGEASDTSEAAPTGEASDVVMVAAATTDTPKTTQAAVLARETGAGRRLEPAAGSDLAVADKAACLEMAPPPWRGHLDGKRAKLSEVSLRQAGVSSLPPQLPDVLLRARSESADARSMLGIGDVAMSSPRSAASCGGGG